MLQSALDDGIRNFMTSLKVGGINGSILNKNSQSHASTGSSHFHTESNEWCKGNKVRLSEKDGVLLVQLCLNFFEIMIVVMV